MRLAAGQQAVQDRRLFQLIRPLNRASAVRTCSSASTSSSVPPPLSRREQSVLKGEERRRADDTDPQRHWVAASLYIGGLPFEHEPRSIALSIAELCKKSGLAGVRRIAISDWTAQGVTEYAMDTNGPLAPLDRPAWLAAPTQRNARDEEKHNRGFALLNFSSVSEADAAAGAAAFSGFKVTRKLSKRPYFAEDILAIQASAAAAAAAREARAAERNGHRARQRQRNRTTRDAELLEVLRRAYDAQVIAPADLATSLPGIVGRGILSMVATEQRSSSSSSSSSSASNAPHSGEDGGGNWLAADAEQRWSAGPVYSHWTSPEEAMALGAVDWAAAPAAADPCRGGGLGPGPRGTRKRQQVESFAAVLRAGAAQFRLQPGATVVDFGCGTGSLVLALAHLFPRVNFVALDAKAESIRLLEERAAAAGLSNVAAVTGRIEEWAGDFQLALGLHVCGAGTDAVMAAAVGRGAAFLVSPCCVGKIIADPERGSQAAGSRVVNGGLRLRHPRSLVMAREVSRAQYALLAQTADFSGNDRTDGYDEHSLEGALPRAAKAFVEADRALAAREEGYEVLMMKLLHRAACVRNDILVGWKKKRET